MSKLKVRLHQAALVSAITSFLVFIGCMVWVEKFHGRPGFSFYTSFLCSTLLVCLVCAVYACHVSDFAAIGLAIDWHKYTGEDFESAPISWAVKRELRRKQWGERNTLWQIGLGVVNANVEVTFAENEVAHMEQKQKEIDRQYALPSQVQMRKKAHATYKDALATTRKSLRKRKRNAARLSKRFHVVWDFFKVKVYEGHQPVNPKTGRSCKPKPFLEWVASNQNQLAEPLVISVADGVIEVKPPATTDRTEPPAVR